MGFHGFFLFAILIPYISFGTSSHESQNLTSSSLNDLEGLIGFSSCLESAIPDWNSYASPDYCTWSGVTCVGTSVVRLELGSTRLMGKICESLVGLDQLRVLNLSDNLFTGSLPNTLFHLQNLEVMDLSNNHFEGPINTAICSSLPQLRVIKLSGNLFSGKIPGNLGNCSSLQHLSINENNLSGSLPGSIFQLQYLRVLLLQENKLSGQLSKGLGKLSNLVEFDISNNEFSGILPNIFGSLTRLKFFCAEANRFTGQLPASLLNSPSLQILNLRGNSLGGSVNLNCSAMKNLTTIVLGYNQFHCPVLVSLSNCLRLEGIGHGSDHLHCGEIPVNFKKLQSLTQLSLSYTGLHNLSSALEVLSHCRNLSTLLLPWNFHNEQMPQPQGQNIVFSNLKVLVLSNSQIKGSFPKWLSGCKMLQMLDLSWNHLTGSIPSWIGNLNNLYYLNLSNNSFTGKIPQSLTVVLSLQLRNLSLEQTTFAFPFKMVGNVNIYKRVSSYRPSLVLSYNKLEGPMWPGFGNLKSLHVMDLKHNSLSGPIPWQLSGMVMMEILDLSHNKLTGEIPQSLIELSFLSSFDVSYNQLHGEIPEKGQFDTFPPTSFQGNMDLYYSHDTSGFILSPPDETCAQPHYQKLEIIGFPFWFGGVAGFLITIAMCFTSGWLFS
ncbi:hypothetical protein GLYMA_19G100700v4 [Glycine max]|uniref:phytosulfokine receptor 1 n=1 Tax=Glycine max TaxID=3847 RepID=UPI000233E5C2|nr:phytosulfokine receptor 1 [Glycine max]KRG94670.2 hypothetical protein GLYMA_19G100700v4 [Glycine max]|eukprot:XP_003553297.1 phytosulfokine receptor 1 [Glycine max]